MDAQLRLIPRVPHRTTTPAASTDHEPAEAPIRWRIDETARERGRAGISRAREVLRQSRRPLPHDGHVTAA